MKPSRLLAALALMAAAPPAWSPDPWLADLARMRAAMQEKYANLHWLTFDRGLDLATLFDPAARRIATAGSDGEARAVFDGLVRRIADGHVNIDWPRPVPAHDGSTASVGTCTALGFDARQATPGIALYLPGYRPLADALLPAGTVTVAGKPVGVVRIGVFQPQGTPALCTSALAALKIAPDSPCDDACRDRVSTETYDRLTLGLMDDLRRLRAAGATALLIDISDNGGGSEWAEAVARMVSARPIQSERRGFVRGSHWVAQWRDLAQSLRKAAATADPADRPRLESWARDADAAQTRAITCPANAACDRIGRAGFATGLVGEAKAGTFQRDGWGPLLFSPAQFPYRDGAWRGPLVVLVDDETWSAAEEFAAVLQDNRAAVILGARTGGAGCGHTEGGTPTTLTHSGATLELPDCIRFRRDGSNEVAGVIPDILAAIRAKDGPPAEARMVMPHLADALVRARAMAAMR